MKALYHNDFQKSNNMKEKNRFIYRMKEVLQCPECDKRWELKTIKLAATDKHNQWAGERVIFNADHGTYQHFKWTKAVR